MDRWQVCHFEPPSHVLIEVGVALAGHGGKDAPDGGFHKPQISSISASWHADGRGVRLCPGPSQGLVAGAAFDGDPAPALMDDKARALKAAPPQPMDAQAVLCDTQHIG